MNTFKLTLEYDGTDFSGWQSQTNGRTVQDIVEQAIRQVTGEVVRIAGGGRTDAGVHAEGQVASFGIAKNVSAAEIQRSLNGVLPADVVVRNAEIVPEGFHARYSAVSRTYRYTILRGPTALQRRTSWSVGWDLNTPYLSECAQMFLGTHDFRSFSKVGSEVKDWMCDVSLSSWDVQGNRLAYTIRSNRFLYGMVRALVGMMIDVARGYRQMDDVARIMRAKDRAAAGMAAPAHGLCLLDISYGA